MTVGASNPKTSGYNDKTTGLLRQYFPKGSDLRVHGPGRLATVAGELNDLLVLGSGKGRSTEQEPPN